MSTDVLLHLSKHQTRKNKQADCWIFNAKHLTMTDIPDAFILYFFHTAGCFDVMWTAANLSEKPVRKSFLWQIFLVRNSAVGWQQNTHTIQVHKSNIHDFLRCKCCALLWSCIEDLMATQPTMNNYYFVNSRAIQYVSHIVLWDWKWLNGKAGTF